MQKRTKLPSGHELTINKVTLDAAANLLELVSIELAVADKSLSQDVILALLSKDMEKVMGALGGNDVNTFLTVMLRMLGSRAIRDAVIACMEKWMLEGKAITWRTFEPDDYRGDLLPCAKEVALAALLPFFENLGLKSPSPSAPTSEPQT